MRSTSTPDHARPQRDAEERVKKTVAEIIQDCEPEELRSEPVEIRIPAEMVPLLEGAARIAKEQRDTH